MRRSESRARSRALPASLAAATLLLIAVACGTVTSPDAAPKRAGSLAAAQSQASACHPRGNGTYVLITMGEKGGQAHYAHGDGAPGSPVPGMPSMKFGPDCDVVPRFTNIEGTWHGTYSWNCGGTLTGSAELIFQLFERGDGGIYGVAIYMGDDPEVFESWSYRMVDPVYRANGTLLGGTKSPEGMVVRLGVLASPSHTSVYNEFDGTISPDFMSITGFTLNGDSDTPTSNGCSAPNGYSGTFTVAHIN